jgi:tryptophan synthase alpha chain
MIRIAEKTQGFLYLVSVIGVTGARSEISTRLQGLIASVKQHTDKAINVGFGISTAAQATQIKAWGADGVIVGSALVKLLGAGEDEDAGVAAMKALALELRAALDA